jgi:hypothetical protein
MVFWSGFDVNGRPRAFFTASRSCTLITQGAPLHACRALINCSTVIRHVTGITLDAGIEIWGKRLQMLKEAFPSTAKVAFLGMREGWEGSSGQFLREAGGRLGISLVFMLPQTGTRLES